MFFFRLSIITAILLLAGCNLDANQENATILPPPTEPITTPIAENPAVEPECTIQDDLLPYVVEPGDNLTLVAEQFDITIETIVTANCLTDADAIEVGQVLYVPSITATGGSFGPPESDLPAVGGVGVSFSLSGDAGNILLLRGDDVILTWEQGPEDVAGVRFWLLPPGEAEITPNTQPIGVDNNGSDGWETAWVVPAGLRGQLVVVGYAADGTPRSQSFPIGVSAAAFEDTCELAPADGPLALYTDATTSAATSGTLGEGVYVDIVGRSLDGWFAISVPELGGTPRERLRWLPPESSITTRGDC